MAKALMNDVLKRSLGSPLTSKDGIYIGDIIKVARESNDYYVKYIILESKTFEGPGNRFFTIPASVRFLNITHKNDIELQFPKDDLQFAKGVEVDQCPEPHLKFGRSIFELYNYQASEKQTNWL